MLVPFGNLAHAQVASERKPKGLIAFGPSLEIGIGGDLRFGGDVTLAQYSGDSAFGVAAGFVGKRIYLELQPTMVLGGPKHNLVLGFNPGFVVDISQRINPLYGGQATVWADYARGGAKPWAFPLFPFIRVQGVVALGFTLTAGVMLKLPIPVT
jgi:hypothetical protein